VVSAPKSVRFLCLLWPLLAPVAAGAGLDIKPGVVVRFSAPLSLAQRKIAGDGKVSPFTEALAAVAVPANFSSDRTWPVLVVSATSNPGYNSSRMLLQAFAPPALRAGWIVVAADPPREVAVDDDTNGLRYGLALAALARLQEEWPALARWPRAFGGFSGGGKRSAWMAALSALGGCRPLGVYQAGCDLASMQLALDNYHPPREAFLATPVFLSSGNGDSIATPEAMRDVEATLTKAGFRHVRLKSFNGRHEVDASHIEIALKWFLEVAAAKP
jgi:hypothetical protein